ncbi:hypothetical protein [Corallococcus carmarthensis]|uniref:hypothetical protein n=1 Tax=Corallococcus carmarthensis TaxID=2316728 RepID=UPI0011C35115|nr:hypothetical protein [Corallococcus carmarthensis]
MKLPPRHCLIMGLAFLAACTGQDKPSQESTPSGFVLQALETPKDRVLAVTNWVGTYRVKTRSVGSIGEPANNLTWSDSLFYQAPLRVIMIPFLSMGFGSVDSGFYNLSSSYVVSGNEGVVESNEGKCAETASAFATPHMTFPSDSTIQFKGYTDQGTLLSCAAVARFLDQTYPSEVAGPMFPSVFPADFFTFPLPGVDEPLHLKGRKQFITVNGAVVSSMPSPVEWGAKPIEWEISWDLWPEETEVQLVLDAEDYDTWLPFGPQSPLPNSLANPGELPAAGSFIRVRAALVPLVPTAPDAASEITFFLDSSSIDGIAMNMPVEGAADSPQDLQFEESKNPGYVVEDKNKLRTPEGSYSTYAYAMVSSFDYGAYGSIRAVAKLPNGKVIQSVVLAKVYGGGTDPELALNEPLRIPRRAENSKIARTWIEMKGAFGLGDDDDSELLPGGRGHRDPKEGGDGLTLQEEYRGFIINGIHSRTNPDDVDYFLVNRIGTPPGIVDGINRFTNVTGLKVHQLKEAEGNPSTRLINANHGQVAHLNDQHFVILRWLTDGSGTSKTPGGASTPGNIEYVGISANLSNSESQPTLFEHTVAHELAHSANVPHHGEGGLLKVEWTTTVDGSEIASTSEKVLDPSGYATGDIVEMIYSPSSFLQPKQPEAFAPKIQRFNVAARCAQDGTQSVFSGAHDCLMRYSAQALIKPNPPGQRHIRHSLTDEHEEPLGLTLCSTTEGTGFNGLGENRHGSAASGRGECIKKICVNDRHNHPKWFGGTESGPPCTRIRTTK